MKSPGVSVAVVLIMKKRHDRFPLLISMHNSSYSAKKQNKGQNQQQEQHYKREESTTRIAKQENCQKINKVKSVFVLVVLVVHCLSMLSSILEHIKDCIADNGDDSAGAGRVN